LGRDFQKRFALSEGDENVDAEVPSIGSQIAADALIKLQTDFENTVTQSVVMYSVTYETNASVNVENEVLDCMRISMLSNNGYNLNEKIEANGYHWLDFQDWVSGESPDPGDTMEVLKIAAFWSILSEFAADCGLQ
jgi:hypothetical protein